MRQWFTYFFLVAVISVYAQKWEVVKHPSSHKYSIITDSFTSDFIYSEVSELCEGKAYVSKGELYAYVDKDLNELTPYVFVEAHNFVNGYAIVGDSLNKNIINKRMHVISPVGLAEIRPPKQGLIVVKSHSGTWGIFDVFGREALPLVYDLPPKIVNRNLIIVRQQELYGVVNSKNEVVHNTAYQFIRENGFAYKSGKYLRLFHMD